MRKRKWTIELCHNEALKYETRKEFEINSKKAYVAAVKYKWLSDICLHMKRIGNRMYRCVYVYEFSDNHAYVGISYNITKRNISRKLQSNDAVTKHIKNSGLIPTIKQLSEYVFINVAAELENDIIEMYRTMGWIMLNRQRGGAIGASKKHWTKEKCHTEALKYNSRSEFYYKNNKIYAAAQRYGWLDEICQHMSLKFHHWTINEIKNEALKYNSRNEFQLNNKAAYVWAIRHNVLDMICSHMCSKIGNNQYNKIK